MTEIREPFKFRWMPYLIIGSGLLAGGILAANAAGIRVVEMNVPVCVRHRKSLRLSRHLSLIGKWIIVGSVLSFIVLFATLAWDARPFSITPTARAPSCWRSLLKSACCS